MRFSIANVKMQCNFTFQIENCKAPLCVIDTFRHGNDPEIVFSGFSLDLGHGVSLFELAATLHCTKLIWYSVSGTISAWSHFPSHPGSIRPAAGTGQRMVKEKARFEAGRLFG
jgi:hypothetical protein